MTWQSLDKLMRNGARLHLHTTFGYWIESPSTGWTANIHGNVAKALLRRDLAVVLEKKNDLEYVFRSKYHHEIGKLILQANQQKIKNAPSVLTPYNQ